MEYLIGIKIEALDEGGYLATSEALPGFLAQGRTIAETIEIAQDVARKLIESYVEHGDPLPEALLAEDGLRGTVELRIPVPGRSSKLGPRGPGKHRAVRDGLPLA